MFISSLVYMLGMFLANGYFNQLNNDDKYRQMN